MCVRVDAGAPAATVCLREPGGETTGEPEQEAGGEASRRGGQEHKDPTHIHDSSGEGAGVVTEKDIFY